MGDGSVTVAHPPPPPRTKANIVRKRERIALVLEMLVGGVPAGTIQTELAKRWSCTQRAVRGYISECRCKILPTWYEWSDARAVASELIAKLDRVYAKSVAAGDHQSAVRAIRQQAELYGLNSARMIAKERDSLAQQLEQLRRDRDAPEGSADDAPRDQANAVRQVYGQRTFATQEDYARWVASLGPRQRDGN